MKSVLNIGLALKNVRSRFFHTFLSILGMVIGVAALVGTLSLIDGMEQFAKGQIESRTSIQTMQVSTRLFKEVNGLRVPRETYSYFTFDKYQALIAGREDLKRSLLRSTRTGEILLLSEADSVASAARLNAIARSGEPFEQESEDNYFGRFIDESDIREKRPVCLINGRLAESLVGEEGEPEELLGKYIQVESGTFEIIGVGKKAEENSPPDLFFPITLLNEEELREAPPALALEARDVEQVNPLKEEVEAWLKSEFENGKQDFNIQTSAFWLEQAEKGFLLFRLIMGLIVGLSVLVGGIGIMNVMLISVNERTTEIGICKAMGAKRKDIFQQYLTESITISGLGSLLGLILGILATLAVVPIIKAIADVPFEAAYTLNTLLVIGTIAVLIGVIFGTYPVCISVHLTPLFRFCLIPLFRSI